MRPDGKISLQLIGDMQAAGVDACGAGVGIASAYRSELSNPARSRPGARARRTRLRRRRGRQAGRYSAHRQPDPRPGHPAGGRLPAERRTSARWCSSAATRRAAVGYAIDIRPVIGGVEPERRRTAAAVRHGVRPASKIADVNLWIKQYIANNMPFPIRDSDLLIHEGRLRREGCEGTNDGRNHYSRLNRHERADFPLQEITAMLWRRRALIAVVSPPGCSRSSCWPGCKAPTYRASAKLMVTSARATITVSPDANEGPHVDPVTDTDCPRSRC